MVSVKHIRYRGKKRLPPVYRPTEAYSYVIFKEGDTYYAKNGKTREVEYKSSDASEVINSAVNIEEGGKIVLLSDVEITSTITLDKRVVLDLCGHVMKSVSVFSPMLQILENEVIVKDGILNSNWRNEVCVEVKSKHTVLQNLRIEHPAQGVKYNAEETWLAWNVVINCLLYDVKYGVETTGTYKNNALFIKNTHIGCRGKTVSGGYGIKLGSGESIFIDSSIENVETGIIIDGSYGVNARLRCENIGTVVQNNYNSPDNPHVIEIIFATGVDNYANDYTNLILKRPSGIDHLASDYGGNFTNFTPPSGYEGRILVVADTNPTNPAQRLYVYINGTWRYVDLT
ncbi:hypothetical protein DRN52_06300 [Thermococci archaeon]|nr:MAG: hypothetical protein DRN52_06300 [Thermococci archaeon]